MKLLIQTQVPIIIRMELTSVSLSQIEPVGPRPAKKKREQKRRQFVALRVVARVRRCAREREPTGRAHTNKVGAFAIAASV